MAEHGRDTIDNGRLENWDLLGSGGFGFVFSADHKDLGKVAIKLAHDGSYSELCREADYMEAANQQYVPIVHGMYKDSPPGLGSKVRQGIVMELMEGGSLQTLLQTLSKPPPWPLAFRLAHQVAVAMDFLHSKNNLVHMDLKPDNILLDAKLNAKIADFGLSTVSNSVLDTASKGVKGGTLAFIPPEAFEDDYHRVRSYDVYSYAILLWAILTGEKPYAGPGVDHAFVKLRIQMGDRPPLDKIDVHQAAGLEDLVELMKRCWDPEPKKRPLFTECIEVTSRVSSRHEEGIDAAVSEVQTKESTATNLEELKPLEENYAVSSPDGKTESVSISECIEVTGRVEAVSEIQTKESTATNLEELKPLGENYAESGSDGKTESVSNLRPQASLKSRGRPNTMKKWLNRLSHGSSVKKETGPSGHVSRPPVPPGSRNRQDFLPHLCELTLDPNTAYRGLSLSENNMKVTHVREHHQYPDHPDRFKDSWQVMCRESLTACCYREVEWTGGVHIAVTYRGINRQGGDSWFGDNDMSWSLECGVYDHRYTVSHNGKQTVLPDVRSSSRSGRVSVYVDWPAGTVSFYTVSSDTLTHLHTFQSTFTEPLYAGFLCWRTGSSVSLCVT